MQKDFHHAVIYVLARLAGFDADEAGVISYSSQYVDDEVRGDVVYFDTGAIYQPICSSHKMVDGRNFNMLANHLSWVPFHFLPGDKGDQLKKKRNDEMNTEDFEERVVCVKNSAIAREMLKECFHFVDTPNFLHRIGVTLHVYADTWAHQKFSGIQSAHNMVQRIDDEDADSNWLIRVVGGIKDFFVSIASRFIDKVMPLGHGAALVYPDLPYLTWKYKDHRGLIHERNNVEEFMDAVTNIFSMLVQFRKRAYGNDAEPLAEGDAQAIRKCFTDFTDVDANARHKRWIDAIADGLFTFGAEDVEYKESGKGSWEDIALGEELFRKCNRRYYEFKEHFMTSDWKMFHDALKDHQYFLNRVMFPRYNLCLA